MWRYGVPNVGRTDMDTERKMEEGKEKEEGGGRREKEMERGRERTKVEEER